MILDLWKEYLAKNNISKRGSGESFWITLLNDVARRFSVQDAQKFRELLGKIIDCPSEQNVRDYGRFVYSHRMDERNSIEDIVFGELFYNFHLNSVPFFYDSCREAKSILDIGCGSGWITVFLAKQFPEKEFIGIDICREAIDRARERAVFNSASNVNFLELSIYLLSGIGKKYDLAILSNVLDESIKENATMNTTVERVSYEFRFPEKFLQVSSVLESGGKVCIAMDPFPQYNEVYRDNLYSAMASAKIFPEQEPVLIDHGGKLKMMLLRGVKA